MYQLITQHDRPQVIDLTAWRLRYRAAFNSTDGAALSNSTTSPHARRAQCEADIERAIRTHCAAICADLQQTDAAVAYGVRLYRVHCHCVAIAIQRACDQVGTELWGRAGEQGHAQTAYAAHCAPDQADGAA